MTESLVVGLFFLILGLVMIRFRYSISRFRTNLNQSVFSFLPDYVTRVTPGGVILGAIVCFFIALLAFVGSIIAA